MNIRLRISCLLACLFLSGCAFISGYDPVAYDTAVRLKGETLALMAKSAEPYTTHEVKAQQLLTEMRKAHIYAQNHPGNTVTADMWAQMIAPERNLVGGYLERWRHKGKMKPKYVEFASSVISESYDTIIDLESSKKRH